MKKMPDVVFVILLLLVFAALILFPLAFPEKDRSARTVEIISIEDYNNTKDGVFVTYNVNGEKQEKAFPSRKLAIEWIDAVLKEE